MTESRHIAETESEDYDNESIEQDYEELLDSDRDELEQDVLQTDVPIDEIPTLDIVNDDYNELENYGC